MVWSYNQSSFLVAAHLASRFCFLSSYLLTNPSNSLWKNFRISPFSLKVLWFLRGYFRATELTVEKGNKCWKNAHRHTCSHNISMNTKVTHSSTQHWKYKFTPTAHFLINSSPFLTWIHKLANLFKTYWLHMLSAPRTRSSTHAHTGRQQEVVWVIECEGEARRQA